MAFWWTLLVLAFAFAICKFLLMLIPSNVPSIDVDASDGTFLPLSKSIYVCARTYMCMISYIDVVYCVLNHLSVR